MTRNTLLWRFACLGLLATVWITALPMGNFAGPQGGAGGMGGPNVGGGPGGMGGPNMGGGPGGMGGPNMGGGPGGMGGPNMGGGGPGGMGGPNMGGGPGGMGGPTGASTAAMSGLSTPKMPDVPGARGGASERNAPRHMPRGGPGGGVPTMDDMETEGLSVENPGHGEMGIVEKPAVVLSDEDIQKHGHLALYAMMSTLKFRHYDEAVHAVNQVNSGATTFMELLQARQQFAQGGGDGGGAGGGSHDGEMGLQRIDTVDGRIAEVAFDIRRPTATERAANLLGPVCITDGPIDKRHCAVVLVMQRYRRHFFSNSWYDLEAWALEAGMPLSRIVQVFRQGGDMLRMIAYVVWPNEHINVKKQKLDEVRVDLDRIGTEDLSTRLTVPPSSRGDRTIHDALMKERANILRRIPQSVIDEHPEVYGMSVEQMIQLIEGMDGEGHAGVPSDERDPPVFVAPQ